MKGTKTWPLTDDDVLRIQNLVRDRLRATVLAACKSDDPAVPQEVYEQQVTTLTLVAMDRIDYLKDVLIQFGKELNRLQHDVAHLREELDRLAIRLDQSQVYQ